MKKVKGTTLTAVAIVAATVAASVMWVTPAVADAASKGGGKGSPRGGKSETSLFIQQNIGDGGINSQNYESALDAYDDEAADDFAVPDRQQWDITKVKATGFFASESTWASVNAQSALQPSIPTTLRSSPTRAGFPERCCTPRRNYRPQTRP